MSLSDLLTEKTAEEADQLIDAALTGLDVIDNLTSNSTLKEATAIVTAVRSVIESLKGAFGGTVSADDVKAELATLDNADAQKLAADDAKADQTLADKFPKGE